jgi:hypothetical protein
VAPALSQPVEVQPDFPNGPALKGKVYVFDNAFEQRVITMSEESWGDFGTSLMSLREIAKNQDNRIKELLAENAACVRLLADAKDRLEALREVRRAEKRPEIEAQINTL